MWEVAKKRGSEYGRRVMHGTIWDTRVEWSGVGTCRLNGRPWGNWRRGCYSWGWYGDKKSG